MTLLVFDIESTGLDYKAKDFDIHCVGVIDLETNAFIFDKHLLFNLHGGEDTLIGHNIIKYDIPALETKYEVLVADTIKVFDTLVVWQLLEPGRGKGGYKLETFGKQIGLLKEEFNYQGDLSVCTEETLRLCKRDVEITAELYKYLIKIIESKSETEQKAIWAAIELETTVAQIIHKQCEHGFYFDSNEALELQVKLVDRQTEIAEHLQCCINPTLKGNKLVLYNPGSKQQTAAAFITKYNWKPKKLTPKGRPQMNQEVLESLDYPEAKQLLEYNDVGRTISFIDSWIGHCEDNRIHPDVNSLGTVTRRMTHYEPNLSQVPSSRKTNGEACRRLFSAPPSRALVGMDVKGLEAHVLAHYAFPYDGGELIKTLQEGSIHDKTATGLYGKDFTPQQRNTAKTVFFAWAFGAFPKTLAKHMKSTESEGERVYKALCDTYPHLVELTDKCFELAYRYHSIKTIDGMWVKVDFVRWNKTYKKMVQANPTDNGAKPEAPVNRLVQTTGAILCKRALVIAHETAPWLEFVHNNHDEFIVECDIDKAKEVEYILSSAVTKAGEYYNLRLKLEGETKIGNNWSEVH